ncbi:hypothetical protein BHM03_00042651 [Ensete ventricosum]|nr:hypothetical protein BHM03_00042651 [Ensete ventricosum]
MLEWVEAVENQKDPLLDEAGDPQRPSRFIIEAIEEDEAHPQQVAQSEHGRSSHSTSDTQLSQSSAQRAKVKKKGKAIASATPLERIESGDEAPSQSIQGHSTNTDSSFSTDNGGDAGESYVSTTQVEGGAWTEEQYFTYATQDIDHRARQGTGHVYTRKGKGKEKEKAVDEFEHMRQSLQGAYTEQSSSYSQSSYYGESYGQQQYSDSWSFFSQQQYDTEQQVSSKSRSSDIHQYMPQEPPWTRIIHDDQPTTITTLMHQWHSVYQYTMSSDQFQDWVRQTYHIDMQIHRIEDPEPPPVEARRLFWW